MATGCMHCFVTGKVQGVWFRAHTQELAEKLQLTGWVRNVIDGSVEIIACGDKDSLDALHDWLQVGPEQAEVEDVSCKSIDVENFEGFKIID